MALFNDPGAGRPSPGLEMGGGGGWASDAGSRSATRGRRPPSSWAWLPVSGAAQPAARWHPRDPSSCPSFLPQSPLSANSPTGTPALQQEGGNFSPSPGRPGGLRKPGPPRGTPGGGGAGPSDGAAALPSRGPRDLEPQGVGA